MKTEQELRKEWDESSHDWYAQMKYFTKGKILPPKFYSYIDDYMNSHEFWNLKRAITEKYQDIIIEIKNDEGLLDLILKEDISDPYFDALIEHYNYKYTKDGLTYHIEPVYYEKVTDDEFEKLSCSIGYIFMVKGRDDNFNNSVNIYIRNKYDLYSKLHIYAINDNLFSNKRYVNKFIQELYGPKYDLSNVIIMKVNFKHEYEHFYYKIYRELNYNDRRHLIVMTNIHTLNIYNVCYKSESECRKEYNEYNDGESYYTQMRYFFNGDIPKPYIDDSLETPKFYPIFKYFPSYRYLDDYMGKHNYQELKYNIMLKFENFVNEIKNNYNNSFDLILNKPINDPYFDALVEHYNFRYKKDGLTYYIEPIKYINYSCEFENISASKGYIFIPNEEVDDILENGLFIRNKYGLFSKIHIYASYRRVKYEIDNFNDFIQKIYGQGYNLLNITVIKVNLRDLNVYVCHEADDSDPRHVITMVNIDKLRMEKIDMNKYEKIK